MLGGADNPNGELPSYITGADRATGLTEKANKFALAVMELRRGIGVKP